jgi:hypothetical protein
VVSRDPRSRRFAIELSAETAGKAGYDPSSAIDWCTRVEASGGDRERYVGPSRCVSARSSQCTNGCYGLAFEAPTEFETRKSLKADRLRFRPMSPFAPPKAFQGLALTASGLPSLRLSAEELHAASSPAREFQRGNVNAVGGVDISDGVRLLGFLFQGVSAPPCMDAADTNDNGKVECRTPWGLPFSSGASPPARSSRAASIPRTRAGCEISALRARFMTGVKPARQGAPGALAFFSLPGTHGSSPPACGAFCAFSR